MNFLSRTAGAARVVCDVATATTSTAANVRRFLIFLGGIMAGAGIVDHSIVEPVVGAAMTIGTTVAGEVARRRAIAMEPPKS